MTVEQRRGLQLNFQKGSNKSGSTEVGLKVEEGSG